MTKNYTNQYALAFQTLAINVIYFCIYLKAFSSKLKKKTFVAKELARFDLSNFFYLLQDELA
jgi:hypothetical protein